MTKRFITLKEVLNRVCFSKSHLRRKIKIGEFPQPIKLGPMRVAFLESEIEEWMLARINERKTNNVQ